MPWLTFPRPSASLVVDKFDNIDDIVSDEVARRTIETHLFNQNIQLLLPFNKSGHQLISAKADLSSGSNLLNCIFNCEYSQHCEDFEYYVAKNVPLHLFIHQTLIHGYICKGKLFVTSLNCAVEKEDCMSISPNGSFVLNLTESTYNRLGIEGQRSKFYFKKNAFGKRVVVLDLKSDLCTNSDTKYYQRIFGLMRNSGLKFDVVIKWIPDDRDISSASIIKYFEHSVKCPNNSYFLEATDGDNIHLEKCHPVDKHWNNLEVPFPRSLLMPDFDDIKFADLLNWIGVQFCNFRCHPLEVDEDVTTFSLNDEESLHYKTISCCSMSGFFTPPILSKIISELTETVKSESVAFALVIVNGFNDNLISWCVSKNMMNNEHGKYLSGENSYGIFITNNFALIWNLADPHDFGLEKI